MDITYNSYRKDKKVSITKEKLRDVLMLFAILNSTLMLPFAIFINYAIIIILLLSKQKLILSAKATPFYLLLMVLLFSALRESDSPSGTADGIHYFLSSFLWQIGYVSLLVFKRPSPDDIARLMLWSAFIQGLLIISRLFGVFYLPIYGGLLESNAGVVSIHQREQITAVSMSFSLWVWVIYGRFSFGSLLMLLVSVLAMLFTGSMGAFLSVVITFVSKMFLESNSTNRSMGRVRITWFLFALVLFMILLGYITENLYLLDIGGFDVLQSTRMISDVANGGDWIYFKLFKANSRAEILQNYCSFVSNDTLSFLFGFTKNNWMDLNGELGSPHSFFLEIFVHGGVLFGLYFSALFIYIFIVNFGVVRGLLYLFSFFGISIINSNNFAMPFLAIILMLFSSRFSKQSTNVVNQ